MSPSSTHVVLFCAYNIKLQKSVKSPQSTPQKERRAEFSFQWRRLVVFFIICSLFFVFIVLFFFFKERFYFSQFPEGNHQRSRACPTLNSTTCITLISCCVRFYPVRTENTVVSPCYIITHYLFFWKFLPNNGHSLVWESSRLIKNKQKRHTYPVCECMCMCAWEGIIELSLGLLECPVLSLKPFFKNRTSFFLQVTVLLQQTTLSWDLLVADTLSNY